MSEKFCFGNTELIIAYGDEVYHVLNLQKSCDILFTGHYDECVEYCERAEITHKEALVE